MIQIEKILLATDFSDCARRAQDYACGLAEQFDAELHLLHVLQDTVLMMPEPGLALGLPPNYLSEQKESAVRLLDNLLPPAWCQGKRIVRATSMGNPYGELVQYASANQIDLIVLGTHGRSGISHMLLGSVAEKVVRHAPCPVLTVRSGTVASKEM